MLRLVPRLSEENTAPLEETGIARLLARVLWARGVRTAAEANAFLHPQVEAMHDPMLLSDMDIAVERIGRAVKDGEKITIYGDYDVDGVCATAILVEALREAGGQVDWYIPSRHKEGYGLNADAVRRLAESCKLLITVDCGITSVEEAALARSLGLDLIITDHHEPPAVLPEAVAVVDPLLGAYPFRRLCGAGVALKVVWALFGREAAERRWDLAALATVADMVPLLDENRIIVQQGLRQMQRTKRPGLRSLLSVAGLDGKVISAGHLGFQIAPRINAGGRLHEASRNVELLLTGDEALAKSVAAALDSENAERQRMEASILREAEQWVLGNIDFLQDKAMVVAGKGWNTGVVGLVASKLVERYAWPCIVLSETEEGMLTGSARSIPGVNIHEALTKCADLFLRFGGHAQAAGMTLAPENLPALRARLNDAVAEIAEPDAFIPSAQYDLDITLPEITMALIEQFEQLAPTGFGNPAPVFHLSDAQVIEARGVGAEGKHLKLRLAQQGVALDGIAFGQGAARAGLPQQVDVLFSPSINEYMGKRSPQCEVARILPHAPMEAFAAQCESRADDFDGYLLRHCPRAGDAPISEVDRRLIAQALAESSQGTLLTVRTLLGAQVWLAWLAEAGLSGRLDYCFGTPGDVRRFNAFCAMPEPEAAQGYTHVFALDDDLITASAAQWLPTDDGLRDLYRVLRAGQGRFTSERALAEAASMPLATVRLGLEVFAELSLVEYKPMPFQASVLPPVKCDLGNSETLRRVRDALVQEGMK